MASKSRKAPLKRGGRTNESLRGAAPRVIRRGLPARRSRDLYHTLLTISWPVMVAMTAGVYILLNLLFALLYATDRGGIANAAPGSFADCFFFSVQTMATIGYGAMYPKSTFANILVSLETVVGLMYFALVTGLWFTRFSRPTARVLFSKIAVVTLHEGVPTLMFRMANERRNQILQAEVRVTLVRDEVTREGVAIRRIHDLPLLRDHSPFFSLSWSVGHPIDASSPFHGATRQSFADSEAQIVVLLAGLDETLNQPVHARFAYDWEQIRWNHRLVDIIDLDADGQRIIDMERFHDSEPLAPAEEDDGEQARLTRRHRADA